MALIFKEHNVDIDTQITLFQTREIYDTQNIENVHMLHHCNMFTLLSLLKSKTVAL